MTIKIGTRNSKLAMWQAEFVRDELLAAGCQAEIVGIETKGDKVLNTSIAKIGSKGVFTEELEEMLLDGEVDIAVHSAKDLQSDLGDHFQIIAFSEREAAHDVIVSHQKINLTDKNLILGTSSTRRVALFKRFYPHIKTVDIRGNLQTRIRKMEEGACDALALAYAGVHRMGYSDLIKQELSFQEFIPAVGQGALAIEAANSLDPEKIKVVRSAINHESTEKLLLAERAYLKVLDGGCSIPAFGMAEPGVNHDVSMRGGIVSLDGKTLILKEISGKDPETIGSTLANEVLEAGGAEILRTIKEKL